MTRLPRQFLCWMMVLSLGAGPWLGIARGEADPRDRLEEGKLNFQDGEFEKALALLDGLAGKELGKKELDLRLYSGFCHYKLGNPEKASSEFQRVLELEPDYRLNRSVAPDLRKAFENARRQMQGEQVSEVITIRDPWIEVGPARKKMPKQFVKKFYKQWWFWALAGAAAAGVVLVVKSSGGGESDTYLAPTIDLSHRAEDCATLPGSYQAGKIDVAVAISRGEAPYTVTYLLDSEVIETQTLSGKSGSFTYPSVLPLAGGQCSNRTLTAQVKDKRDNDGAQVKDDETLLVCECP